MLDKLSTDWKIYPTCHSRSSCCFHYSYSFPVCLTFFNVTFLCWHLNIVFQQSLKGKIGRDLIWPLLHSVKMKNYFSHGFCVNNKLLRSVWLMMRQFTWEALWFSQQNKARNFCNSPWSLLPQGKWKGEKKQIFQEKGKKSMQKKKTFTCGFISTICKYSPSLKPFPSFFSIRTNVGRDFISFHEKIWAVSL